MAEGRVWSEITSATRASAKNPCRACGSKKWPCAYRTHLNTGAVLWTCGDAAEKFYYSGADGHEISAREAHGHERQEGWAPTARRRLAARDAKAASSSRVPAASATCDAVYSRVLELCPVSDGHRAALMARPGMTDGIIRAAGYATAKQLDGVGLLIRGIPGADKVPGWPEPGSQKFQMVSGALLVPVRNRGGDIVGLRQRIEGDEGKKYLWLPGSVPAVHFPAVASTRHSGRLIVTEGEIKADLSTAIGDYTISLPGVSSWRLAIEAVVDCRLVEADGSGTFREMVIALDSDYTRKFGVAQAVAALASEALARGIPASVMDWPEELGKGLDDFLTREGAGRGPDLYSGATFRSVNEGLVGELQALADRLLQEEQDRRDAVAAAAGAVDESQAIGGDEDEWAGGAALIAMLDETQEVGSAGHMKMMAIEADKEFEIDAAKVAVKRIVDRPRRELLLDDDLRRAFIQHAETIGEAECMRLQIRKPVVDLFRDIDRMLANDGLATPARMALAGFLTYDRSEIGFALRMAARYRHEILHAGGLGWYVWDGKVWVQDPGEVRVLAKAQQMTFEIEAEIDFAYMCAMAGVFGPSVDSKARAEYDADDVKEAADQEKRDHARFVARTRCSSFLKSAVSLLRPHLEVPADKMDTYPHLLNTQSGIVDLRTGELGPHDPAMLLTQITSANYNPKAPRGVWTKFFGEVMAEDNGDVDPEYINYLQGYLGYVLWGVATEQKFCSVWGAGSNGKTTLFEAVADVMGSYAQIVEPEIIVKADATSGAGKPRPDLLNLRGARLILASEPERGEAMAEGIVKRLTGNDKLSGRLGHSNEIVNFRIVGKFVLLCNELLRIAGTNVGIWRRQEVWACKRLWRREDDTDPRMAGLPLVDQGLPDALRAEADGILAWMVEGAVRWHREKLRRPKRIMDASAEYRGDQDRVGQFLADRVERDDRRGNVVAQTELYTAYVDWCKAAGTQPMARDRLKGALKDHSLIEGRNGPVGLIWKGVRLLPAPAQPYRDGQATGGGGGWNNGRSSSRDDSVRSGWAQPPQAQQQSTRVLL